MDTLAAAYAESRAFPEAIAAATRAQRLAAGSGEPALVAELEKRLRLYRSEQPSHEAPLRP